MIQANISKRRRGQTESATWYMRHKMLGEKQWSNWRNLNVTEKVIAEEMRLTFIRDAEHEAAGIKPKRALREGAAGQLADALKEYRDSIKATRDAMYVYNVEKHISRLLIDCKWKVPGDVTAESFQAWRSRQQLQPKTLNDYLAEARGFLKWMKGMGRIATNALADVSNLPVRGKESPHRALTPGERDALLMLDTPHSLAYVLALNTGLRRDELEQLLWADVHLDGPKPYLAVSASTTKNGKRARCGLPPNAAQLLRDHKPKAATPRDKVIRVPSMEEFRADCDKAGIDHTPDARGKKVVFHSLRHTLCTDMGRAGVAPAVAIKIMRHSDIKLTMGRYMDAENLATDSTIEAPNYPIPANLGTHKGTTELARISHQSG